MKKVRVTSWRSSYMVSYGAHTVAQHSRTRVRHTLHTIKEKLISLIKFSTPYRNLFIAIQWNVFTAINDVYDVRPVDVDH